MIITETRIPDVTEENITRAKKILAETIDEFGGPYSNHLDSETAQNSFDSTCRKLHRFLIKK